MADNTIITCENSTAPANIDKNEVVGPCDLKCKFNYTYGIYSPNIANNGNYISLNYSGKSNPVLFNDLKYEVQEIRIYRPSLHKYQGSTVDGEILIIHGGSGKNLIVSIPIKVGDKTDKGSTQLSDLITEVASRAPTEGSSITASMGDFSLRNFIPDKKSFFSYNGTLPYGPCNGSYSYIVYASEDALNISQTKMTSLRNIITGTRVDVKPTTLFFNKRGANTSSLQDDIYIDCQPVGSDGQILVNESAMSSTTTTGSSMNMEQIEPILYTISAIILAVGLGYGFHYVFSKFKDRNTDPAGNK
jgi:carbonic anhydrase